MVAFDISIRYNDWTYRRDPTTGEPPVNELAILGLLMEQPLHGYELKKRLTGLLGSRASLSFGSLYPALGRLERGGLVTTVEPDAGGTSVPMTGSLGGEVAAYRARMTLPTRARRNRKVYEITPSGEARMLELLRVPAPDDRDFLVQVAFCRFLTTEERVTLFRHRREELARRLPSRVDGGRDRYLRSVRERDSQAITNDIAWLDRLITDELAIDNDHSPDEAGAPTPAAPDPALPGGPR
jgi:DNA-binding PadR family transcriptional regulator